MRMNVTAVLVIVSLVAAGTPASVTIQTPKPDSVVKGSKVHLAGKLSARPVTGGVTVQPYSREGIPGPAVSATVTGLDWSADLVDLGVGRSVVQIQSGTDTPPDILDIFVTRGDDGDLVGRPVQFARIVWDVDVEETIKKIASETTNEGAGMLDLDGFVEDVKTRTEAVFQAAYFGVTGISQKFATADGPFVHTITMLADSSDGDYGKTPSVDCDDRVAQQESLVWVGEFLNQMTNNAQDWTPMRKTDDLMTRADDLGYALGRTAAHEMGHGIGLVGYGGDECDWMEGTNDVLKDFGHNYRDRVANPMLAARSNHGWFIMDAGGDETINQARIARTVFQGIGPVEDDRRMPAVFNTFNRSYLVIIFR